MKPKLKANELFEKYYQIGKNHDFDYAKECVLLAVDEIILTCAFNDYKTKKYFEHCSDYNDTYFVTYWQEVRREIEKL